MTVFVGVEIEGDIGTTVDEDLDQKEKALFLRGKGTF